MRAPTISEVAKTAGVSVATVSRVVNGSPSVSHETQARVQEAIERLRGIRCGFKETSCPDQLARNLEQAMRKA